MRKPFSTNPIIFIPLLFFFSACTEKDLLPDKSEMERETQIIAGVAYAKGLVCVKLSEELAANMEAAESNGMPQTKALSADHIVSQINMRSMKRTFPYAGRFEERTRKAGLHLWYDVAFDNQIPINEAQKNLSGVQGIEIIEYVPVIPVGSVLEYTPSTRSIVAMAATMPFNDPNLHMQWNLHNDGTFAMIYNEAFIAGADMKIFDAWNITTGVPEVIVAVIDSGIELSHEDIQANMWINWAEFYGLPGFDDDNNGYIDDIYGYNFADSNGNINSNHYHGTGIAGIIAAVNNNGVGICGVAGGNGQVNSGIRLMSCQMEKNGAFYLSSAAAGIKYAADNGAVISNCSFVGGGYAPLEAAINYFIEFAGVDENDIQNGPMRGGLVIGAAGNSGLEELLFPAAYEKVVAVSNMTYDYQKYSESTYGDWIDLTAPGRRVWILTPSGMYNGYALATGTSASAANVSGVAALVLSHFKRPGYTAQMLRTRLESTATDIDSYNPEYKGKLGKLVNAYAAMTQYTTPPNKVGAITNSVRANNITLRWIVPSDPDDGKAFGFNLYMRKTSLNGIDVHHLPSDVVKKTYYTGDLKVGEAFEVEMTKLDSDTSYYFAVDAFDSWGNYSPLSTQVIVKTLPNQPPVITALDNTNVVMKASEIVILRFSSSDPDGHKISWSLQPSTKGVSLVQQNEGSVQLILSGPNLEFGTHSVLLILKDELGASSSKTINYEVLKNHSPELVGRINDLYIGALNKEVVLPLANYFRDPDDDALKYTIVNSAPNIVNVIENNGNLHIVSHAYGLVQIGITATDLPGLFVSQQFNILVRDDNQLIDIYPNPVIDHLWLRSGEVKRYLVTIFNAAGAKVFDSEMNISPFVPAKIDMSSFGGGAYNVVVIDGKNEIKKQIIKL